MDNFSENIAKVIKDEEDSYDSSMRGVLLEEVIDKYVEAYGESFVKLFNNIYQTQKEAYESYGDADYSVTKLKISGNIADSFVYPKDEYDEENKAILLSNIFSDYYFLIIENILSYKESEGLKWGNYYVYKLDKSSEIKSINLEKSKLIDKDNLLVHFFGKIGRKFRLENRSIKHKMFEKLMFTLYAIK